MSTRLHVPELINEPSYETTHRSQIERGPNNPNQSGHGC
jgi:hypothetical protein